MSSDAGDALLLRRTDHGWSKADDRRRVSETKPEELAPAEDLILERGQQSAAGNTILGS